LTPCAITFKLCHLQYEGTDCPGDTKRRFTVFILATRNGRKMYTSGLNVRNGKMHLRRKPFALAKENKYELAYVIKEVEYYGKR
jgi:hypothetical protein